MSYSILDVVTDEIFKQAEYVSPETQQDRINCCSTCNYFIPGPGQYGKICGLCGCVLAVKTQYKLSQCPDTPPKWK